jgi:hypothetical protein
MWSLMHRCSYIGHVRCAAAMVAAGLMGASPAGQRRHGCERQPGRRKRPLRRRIQGFVDLLIS